MKEMGPIQGRKVSLVQAELRTGSGNRVRATDDPDEAIRAAPITAATGGCASGKTVSLMPLAGSAAPDITITSDRGRSPTVRSGDLVSARVRASGDAYIHCYYKDGSGAVSRIFPNRFQPYARVPAGRQVEIPPAAHPFNIRMD
jgi:Domain of unknown function (DUF4384)